jgi:penicillin-binding protein 1B
MHVSTQARSYNRAAVRPPGPTTSRLTYSAKRFRLVIVLLTLVTLPVVLGTSALVYYYLHFSVIVDSRLRRERMGVPARLYSRPLVLRTGIALGIPDIVKLLNGLKYDQQEDLQPLPGHFAVGEKSVIVTPRTPDKEAADEPVVITIVDGVIKDMRGARSKKAYPTQILEPELITFLFDESREKRRIVAYEELPDHLIKAVLAIEDRRFFSHPGLDPLRIAGAALRNLRADSYIQGGSTITQQLVKNFFLTPERTFKRKAQEAVLAFVLERRVSKEKILELYLNEIYLGQIGSFSINGVGEAARMYFHKDVGNLSLTEAALLAGMIQSPNPYNPYRHTEKAKARRDQVLRAMNESGFIEAATAEAAIAQPIKVEAPSVDATEAPYFVDLVRSQLEKHYAPKDTQNLSIYTSLDPRLQMVAQAAMAKGLADLDKKIKRKTTAPVQGCLIAIEPSTGAILALVGGRSYGSSQYNRATEAKRQPGSTFKPFVYLAAFEATFDDLSLPPITPATVVEDEPHMFMFDNPTKEYTPQNYEDHYMGSVTLRKALSNSLNVATVKVAEMVGFDRIANLWSKKLKIDNAIKPYPAVALGAFEATPLQMATAYNVLANGGLKVEPTSILNVMDEKGARLEEHAVKPVRVARAESTFLVVNMMRSVFDGGTAGQARAWGFTADAAGKTGTTNDMRDAWFDGFTPDLLTVVWVGFDDNTPINMSGARAALPIWVDFMKGALAGVKSRRFEVPAENIVFVDIDAETGLRASPSCPKVISESFIAGTEPVEMCQAHGGGRWERNRERIPEN